MGVLLGSSLGRWVPASVHKRGGRTCDIFCCTGAGKCRLRFSIWWWCRLGFVLLPEEVKLKSFFECVAVVGVAEFGWE
jgi:hypothetical protein